MVAGMPRLKDEELGLLWLAKRRRYLGYIGKYLHGGGACSLGHARACRLGRGQTTVHKVANGDMPCVVKHSTSWCLGLVLVARQALV